MTETEPLEHDHLMPELGKIPRNMPSDTFEGGRHDTPPNARREQLQRRSPRRAKPCSALHVPYSHRLAPFSNLKLVPCMQCGKKWVPEVIFATVELPCNLPIRGSGVFVQARVCRSRPNAVGETDALAVSEALPFLEYELARQLMLKLKVLGRNAIFGLKTEVDVGRQLIVSTASATAVYCTPMPAPRILEIHRTIAIQDDEDKRLVRLQRQVEQISSKNRQRLSNALHWERNIRKKRQVKPLRERGLTSSKRSSSAGTNRDEGTASLRLSEGQSSSNFSQSMRTTPIDAENDYTLSSMEEESDSTSSSSSSSSDSSYSATAATDPTAINNEVSKRVSLPSECKSDSEAASGREKYASFDDDKSIASAVSEMDEEIEARKDGELRRRDRRTMYRDDKLPFVLEIDDETDEDFLSVLLDKRLPGGIRMCSTARMPTFHNANGSAERGHEMSGQMVMAMLRFNWDPTTRGTRSNLLFSGLFQELFSNLCNKIRECSPAVICGLRTQVNLTPDDQVELICYGKVVLGSYEAIPRIPESGKKGHDAGDAKAERFAEEIELKRQDDAEMAVLEEEVESSVSALFSTNPMIGQNRSTVIVDELSETMRKLHRARSDDSSEPSKPDSSSFQSQERRVVSTGRIDESPSIPHLGSSPKSNALLTPSIARLSPISPRSSSRLQRNKSEGTSSLRLPEIPASSSRGDVGQPNVLMMPSSLKMFTVGNPLSPGWMKIEEVPVELTPLHYVPSKLFS
jgi:hypothetical protein